MKLFQSIYNNQKKKKFLIPKDSKEEIWVEIEIDNENKTFIARKKFQSYIDQTWIESNDYTFPSSLLNEFLNNE